MSRVSFLTLASLSLTVVCGDILSPDPFAVDPQLGVEPSPFFPSAANQLDAIPNPIKDVWDRLDGLLTDPPDPYQPVVGNLGAMSNEVNAQTVHLTLILAGVPEGALPDDIGYGAFSSALGGKKKWG